MATRQNWSSKIVGLVEEAPDQLLANPLNARRHPGMQRDAIRASLDLLGWVAPVIMNQRTGNLVDGHARVEEALSARSATIPVLIIDVSEDEERIMLATYDPIGALAIADQVVLAGLLDSLPLPPDLESIMGSSSIPAPTPPKSAVFDENKLVTQHECPKCGYEF